MRSMLARSQSVSLTCSTFAVSMAPGVRLDGRRPPGGVAWPRSLSASRRRRRRWRPWRAVQDLALAGGAPLFQADVWISWLSDGVHQHTIGASHPMDRSLSWWAARSVRGRWDRAAVGAGTWIVRGCRAQRRLTCRRKVLHRLAPHLLGRPGRQLRPTVVVLQRELGRRQRSGAEHPFGTSGRCR